MLVRLPSAQENAAASVSSRPARGTAPLPGLCRLACASTSMPPLAIAMPTKWLTRSFSPISTTPNSRVKNTCACSTSEASPAGIPTLMATNRNANCAKLMVMPYSSSHFHGIVGRGIKKIAGNATSKKRIPASRNGGMPCKPNLITTKFTPQITTTNSANSRSRNVILAPLIPLKIRFSLQVTTKPGVWTPTNAGDYSGIRPIKVVFLRGPVISASSFSTHCR